MTVGIKEIFKFVSLDSISLSVYMYLPSANFYLAWQST